MNELFRIFAEITERFVTTRQSGKDQGIRTRVEVRAWNAIADTARAHGFMLLTESHYKKVRGDHQMSASRPMTREKMEQLNPDCVIRGTYRGPLDWELCIGLYDDLQQAQHVGGGKVFPVGTLYIVSQGEGYNIVTKERKNAQA